jgi:tetratricopeptide (TPR) repeat protein
MRDAGALSLGSQNWAVSADAVADVPRQVRDLIDTRVDRLGTDSRHALTLLSVAGPDCSFQILRDAGSLDEARLLDALDRALEANLIEERGDGYTFLHPLVRSTVYERLSRRRRASLHAALAKAIERLAEDTATDHPAPIEALAHHWVEAGESTRAVPYLLKSANRAARVYANTEAIGHLRHALEILEGPAKTIDPDPRERTAILEQLCDLYALIGEVKPARSAYDAAIRVGALDSVSNARLRLKSGQQALFAGSLAAADILLDEAWSYLGDEADDPAFKLEGARVSAVQAQSHFLSFRFPEALAASEKSLRLAEEAGSRADVARACEMVAMASLPLGQWQRGIEFERRFDVLSDTNLIVLDSADVHLCLSEYHVYSDQPADAARAFLRALTEAERVGATRSLALCHYYLGNMAYFRGKFAEALIRLYESISLYRQVESSSGEAIAIMMHGMTLTALGRLDEARTSMEGGLELAASSTLRSHASIRLLAGLGRNRLDANDAAGARDYAEQALALAEEPSDCICYAAVHPVATAAFALTGDLPRAVEFGDRALTQARAINSPPLMCMAQQVNGLVHGLTGCWDSAFSALDEAQLLAERHGLPYERARTLLMRSFVHMHRRSRRDLVDASRLTSQAWPILIRLGVRTSTAQARSSIGFMRGQMRSRSTARRTDDLIQ